MPAPEKIEIVETTDIPARKACLTAGCPCKDARIVSYRRASFYATVARRAGETADRVVPADPGWRIPAATAPGLDLLRRLPEGIQAPALQAETVRWSTLAETNDG
jgi:hypothetical protein